MKEATIDLHGRLGCVARFPRLRVLAWSGDQLYASRGYQLLRASIQDPSSALMWQPVARFQPDWRRRLSVMNGLSARLFRDGFHALAVLPSGGLVAAVPGAIVTLGPGETEFRRTHCNPSRNTPAAHHRCSERHNLLGRILRQQRSRGSPHLRLHRCRRDLERRLYIPQGRHPPRPQHRSRSLGRLPLGLDRRLRRRMPHPARHLRFQSGRSRSCKASSRPAPLQPFPPKMAFTFLPTRRSNPITSIASTVRNRCCRLRPSAVRRSMDAALETASSSPRWWNPAK